MKTCLVVDDSRVIRKVARRILEDLAFTVEEAGDGSEALSRCRSSMPDAILLDWNMPVMNGLEFLHALRADPGGERPVVVFCTTENDLSAISQAIEMLSGAAGSRWFGGTRWGAVGAILGSLVGMFFMPIGLLLGPLLGAFVCEMAFARKQTQDAAISGVGSVVGVLAGMGVKITVGVLMIAWFFLDVFLIGK